MRLHLFFNDVLSRHSTVGTTKTVDVLLAMADGWHKLAKIILNMIFYTQAQVALVGKFMKAL